MADSLQDVLTRAIADFAEHGYDSRERLAYWQAEIRRAAEASLTPDDVMVRMLQEAFGAVYQKLIDKGDILEKHPGVERFTVARLKPQLRSELSRRVMASADLIKLNREEMIAQTVRRFSGWASSVPAGGSDEVKKAETKANIRKGVAGAPFAERRVLIDQGHKFTSALSEIIASDTGAIAAKWHSFWRQPGYNYREDHKERDGIVYVVPDNWAMQNGLMKLAGHEYTNDITKPAEEPFCRCQYRWIYHLIDLPTEMLTEKGRAALKKTAA